MSDGLTRRAWLKTAGAIPLGGVLGPAAFGREAERSEIAAYLETLARSGGGYAWDEQAEPHLTPTFAAIGCYSLLKIEPPNRAVLAEFVRTHHPSRLGKLEQEHREFEFQQIQSLVWLGEGTSSFRAQVQGWTRPQRYLPQYEKHSYPVFRSQLTTFTCRELLGLPTDDLAPEFVAYLDARRRPDGSFNNTPATEGGGGHVLNTLWGLQALRILGRSTEKKAETIAWLRACQVAGGGFTYQPDAKFGGVDDVAYTRAAVRALRLLGAEPADRAGCVRYLGSLWNPDAGAGDRPGWLSNPVATYYTLDAFAALDESTPAIRRSTPARTRTLPSDLKVFTIQLEAHGQGSPAEAVELARALKIHLWGAKNARREWLARAQTLADHGGVSVQFFVANEEYGTWVDVPGLGTYSHTSDILAPAGSDVGPSLANQGVVSWSEYRARRLEPLQKGHGRLVWQFGENEELVRLFLDDSLQRGGFAAISTFHFGNADFTNTEPFLARYRGQIPFVALQDAHGAEPWWFTDMTTGFRTLFLAREPTWKGWLEALGSNRVVAVRHDARTGFKTWIHGGSREVIDFVHEHQADWRWWDNPAIARPIVSLVALTPDDIFETARPAEGVTLRVRCAWENTPQGLPHKPITELVRLTIDGTDVKPTLVTRKRANGTGLADHYHEFAMHTPAPGKHRATAVVRTIETETRSSQSVDFGT